MVLDDISQALSTGGIGAEGGIGDYAIYKGFLPNVPDKCVALFEYGSAPPVEAMASSPGQALAERPRVQVLVRSTAYSTGRQKANDAFKLLDGFGPKTVNSTLYMSGYALSSPFFLRRDENDRIEFAFNAEFTKALSTA